MYFDLVGEIFDVETIAVGKAIRDVGRLRKRYGPGRWRKLKGTVAFVVVGCGVPRYIGTRLMASGACA